MITLSALRFVLLAYFCNTTETQSVEIQINANGKTQTYF